MLIHRQAFGLGVGSHDQKTSTATAEAQSISSVIAQPGQIGSSSNGYFPYPLAMVPPASFPPASFGRDRNLKVGNIDRRLNLEVHQHFVERCF